MKISSDNNKSLAPLAGLHGDKLLVEALYQMFPQNGVSDNYAWVRALSKVTGWSMAAKTTERLWKAFSPGASDTGARIIKAGVGDVSDSGRAYNLANEPLGLAAGQRITEVNVEQALGFKASKFSRDIRDASSLSTATPHLPSRRCNPECAVLLYTPLPELAETCRAIAARCFQ